VTLEDAQKFLGLSVRGCPVTGQCKLDGGVEWRPSSGEHFLRWDQLPEPQEYLARNLLSVRTMQTRRQLPTTTGLGSFTCLVVCSSLTAQVTPRLGCTYLA
jgi:hypothetical protein